MHDAKLSPKRYLVFTLFPLGLSPIALSSPRVSPGGRAWEEAPFHKGLAHTLPPLETLKPLTYSNPASKLGNVQAHAEGMANTFSCTGQG